jgi:cystathionine beta-lyase
MLVTHDFDELIERRSSGSAKWNLYDEDVLPLWVADMDFRSPESILRALHERVDHGVFGYEFDSQQVRDALVKRMAGRFNWQIKPEDLMFVPNLVSTLHYVCIAYADPGDEVIMSTPVYPPFVVAPGNTGRTPLYVDMAVTRDSQELRYEIDFDAFEAAITPRTKAFLLCNPHNPVGRMWTRVELEQLAAICLRHNIVIISDEIHSDLIMDDLPHIPMATLAPEVADRTVTINSPSKTFNMPTIHFAFVMAQNADLLKKLEQTIGWLVPHPGALGFAAAHAAYTECQDWVDDLLVYLRGNRDLYINFIRQHFPSVGYTCPEATYLGWMDWRALKLPGESPFQFFLDKARVAFNDGAAFGKAGEGFTRINYATSRARLQEALERVRAAVEDL